MISIIIPTYNRKVKLEECLAKLSRQSLEINQYEVLIIDDGSTDKTTDVIATYQEQLTLRYYRQENQGPAVARNKGIREAKGEIVLFLGDDIYADTRLLEYHQEYHRKYSSPGDAVLGYIDWDKRLKVTSLMNYVNRGPQFAFHRITNPDNCGYAFFYTSNISLKKSFLLENGLFDEEFRKAACEDTELAYRLEKKGLKIHYRNDAIGYHDHPITFEEYLKRAYLVGQETLLLQKKHPGIFGRKLRTLLCFLIQLGLPVLKSIARKSSESELGNDMVYRLLFLYYLRLGMNGKKLDT